MTKEQKSEYDKKRYLERKASGAHAAHWAKNKERYLTAQSITRKAKRLNDKAWADADRKRSLEYRAKNMERLKAYGAIHRANPENRKRASERTRAWYDKNKIRAKETSARWIANNPGKNAAYSKAYRTRHPEKRRIVSREWKERNPGKVAADRMFRLATELMATPKWVDRSAIDSIYKKSAEVTMATGIKHHVDHIYPLRGRGFVGLHVPWNLQILTASENCSKGNRI